MRAAAALRSVIYRTLAVALTALAVLSAIMPAPAFAAGSDQQVKTVRVGWLVSNEGNLTVALEVELTDDLRREGMARELINRIQNLRKESGLEITDRIVVSIDPHKETDEALETFGDLVRQQVLANEIVVKPTDGDEIDLGDFTTHIAISKA